MKLLKIVINGLPHFKNELDIDFVALQRVDDYDKERLCNVFSNIYVNKAISFVGINASGKTTILKACQTRHEYRRLFLRQYLPKL